MSENILVLFVFRNLILHSILALIHYISTPMCVDLVSDDFVGGAWLGRVVMGEWFALLYNGGEK